MINNFTTTKIDFINNIDQTIIKHGKFYYYKFEEFRLFQIIHFLSLIKDDQIYSIFPFISTTNDPNDPYLRLSNHFIVTNKSDPKLIYDFLNLQ